MKKFIKENSVELIAGGIVLIGIFVMMERSAIRAAILSFLMRVTNPIFSVLKRIFEGIGYNVAILTPSEVLGGLLILLAVGFIVWRIRHRFQKSLYWASYVCPKCSGPITRVHRTWFDRILGATLLPEARRFRCVSSKCNWSGLRRRVHHHDHPRERVSESENP